uniref:Magnetosome protein MamC n=1 Tax=Magnetococcus massalia (strain MO-1) TaxID=451514 RepID=A0A1S7LCW8_MAGMO|nr:Magnetosome protein MamC [Candidatus Magnetococcus massalia]
MAAFNLAMYLAKSAPGVGVLGGVVGGSAALAKNLKAKQDGADISTEEIVIDTSKEALGAGVATTISAYTVGVVGGGLVLSLGTAFAAAVAGKYAWDYGVEKVEQKLQEKAADAPIEGDVVEAADPFDPSELETP